jgi:hypothetical protein
MTTLSFIDEQSLRPVREAIEQHRIMLEHSLLRTKNKLRTFEEAYSVDTAYFLENMSAEDLQGGDVEYIEWAGEAEMLASLQRDIYVLEDARSNLR